jgi:hypothetical protein
MGRLQNNPSIEWAPKIYTCMSISLHGTIIIPNDNRHVKKFVEYYEQCYKKLDSMVNMSNVSLLNFVLYTNWQWFTWKFNQIWPQAKYEKNNPFILRKCYLGLIG